MGLRLRLSTYRIARNRKWLKALWENSSIKYPLEKKLMVFNKK